MKKIFGLILIGASALVLGACGSSGSDAPAPVTTPAATDIPASATTDSAGLLTYVNAQIGASSDTGEPVVVGDATVLPVDNTTETSL